MKYLVTGGYGFIGSNFVELLFNDTDVDIDVIDNGGYACNFSNIPTNIAESDRFCAFICDLAELPTYLLRHPDCNLFDGVDTIFHFAAESHVDNSIAGPEVFISSNVYGTLNLLEQALSRGIKVVYISTDEVYGALDKGSPPFIETQALEPNNVYSATKGAAEMLVRAYHKTHKLDVVTTRCCNNYGPHQHTEKLLPKTITLAHRQQSIPVYGAGDNIREWIHVKDHCEAILHIHEHGKSGEIYNIGSGVEYTNIELVKTVLNLMKKPESLITFVEDRKGHDFRYSINCDKLKNLGWSPKYCTKDKFTDGLRETIEWFINK